MEKEIAKVVRRIMEEEIIEFIRLIRDSFIGSDIVYTQGSCYKFFKILKSRFPESKAYYDSEHVITKIGGKFYDITGEVKKGRHLLVDEHYSHEVLDKLTWNIYNVGFECCKCDEINVIEI